MKIKQKLENIKLYNHTINKVSELDMRMILSIPEGGNWKHIPENIPSKRLEGIRKTGGRTTLYGRLNWNKPSYTISTYFTRPGNGTYIHPNDHKYDKPIHRLITPREAARLQSFPDNYKFLGSKSSIATQIGNAVPPILGYIVAQELKKELKQNLNVIDLFSGAGGLGLGFKKSGYNILVANDNFKQACETYRFNNPETPFVEGDITLEETKNKILNLVKDKKVDVICGGPPCQGFSLAGKRLSEDPRNFLFKEFVSLVEQVKPKFFVMENVEGIVSSNGGKTYKSIIEEFSLLGYNVSSQIFNSANYGVPQKRKRVIIVGSLIENFNFHIEPLIEDENKFLTVKDAISNLVDIEPHPTDTELTEYPNPKTKYQEYLANQISVDEFLKSISN
ncbi:DNA (cytosine-5-)-methyltransferase [Aliarcobacter butzleri]|uniref:DNA (cytosine-5-)-methyltransferase n=1 Tax=Aliarcobacter butzleri TaxID=28197 RepID=UPI001EDA86EE|nr:DNA (cytosine-5-)-methyltransferase [Aliarcobacter butzleri]MCG3666106.1 DNA (cytosine-5-)-methyltransferase [Aliarcobacter butzleri]